MPLNALLLCREHHALQMLGAALDALDIEQDICLSAPAAMEKLATNRYSALVLDFDLPASVQVARVARIAPPQKRPVVFAMIGASTGIASALQAGANFVLYKPLIHDQIMRSLRAGRGFMRPDRRSTSRQKIESLVYLQFGIAALPAIVLNVTEKGLALQAAEPLPAAQSIPFRFVLPGTPHMIDGSGEMIWADDNGRVGMLFTEITAASKKHLKEWLSKHAPQERTAKSASRVTGRQKVRAASASN
jgi:CheY-like chemotaxis protein